MKKTIYDSLEDGDSVLLGKLKNRVKIKLRVDDFKKKPKKLKKGTDQVWDRFWKGLR
jgi:hypothetical protein